MADSALIELTAASVVARAGHGTWDFRGTPRRLSFSADGSALLLATSGGLARRTLPDGAFTPVSAREVAADGTVWDPTLPQDRWMVQTARGELWSVVDWLWLEGARTFEGRVTERLAVTGDIAIWAHDRGTSVVDFGTGQILAERSVRAQDVSCGAGLCTVTGDRRVVQWTRARGFFPPTPGTAAVRAAAVAPDGTRAWLTDTALVLEGTHPTTCALSVPPPERAIVAVSRDQRWVAAAGDGGLLVIEVPTCAVLARPTLHAHWRDIVATADGWVVASPDRVAALDGALAEVASVPTQVSRLVAVADGRAVGVRDQEVTAVPLDGRRASPLDPCGGETLLAATPDLGAYVCDAIGAWSFHDAGGAHGVVDNLVLDAVIRPAATSRRSDRERMGVAVGVDTAIAVYFESWDTPKQPRQDRTVIYRVGPDGFAVAGEMNAIVFPRRAVVGVGPSWFAVVAATGIALFPLAGGPPFAAFPPLPRLAGSYAESVFRDVTVATSADGRWLAIGARDRLVVIEVRDGSAALAGNFDVGPDGVTGVAFRDGQLGVVLGDGTLLEVDPMGLAPHPTAN